MKPLLYLETTIPSYLTSKPSRDLIVAARQRTTLDWWLRRQHDFQVFVSQIVLDEAAEGDRQAAAARLAAIEVVPLLAVNDEVISLAQMLLRQRVLPRKATRDAAHIAVSAVHGMHFLLTWNCAHLANAEIFDAVEAVCAVAGYKCPINMYANRVVGGIAMAREKKTNGDPIVAEVRKIKDRLAARYGYDARAMLRDAMRRQKRQGKKVVTLAKRPISGR